MQLLCFISSGAQSARLILFAPMIPHPSSLFEIGSAQTLTYMILITEDKLSLDNNWKSSCRKKHYYGSDAESNQDQIDQIALKDEKFVSTV